MHLRHMATTGYVAVVTVLALWPTHPERPVADAATRTIADRASSPTTDPALDPHQAFDLLGNVAFYVPLGILLAVSLRHCRWYAVLAAAPALSAALELAQHLWLPGRHGTPRDVVANTVGAALGVLAAKALHALSALPTDAWSERTARRGTNGR